MHADLGSWGRTPFSGGGLTYDCFEKGEGPGVVLIPEIPGLTPEVASCGEHLVSEGFTVVIPSPFGTPVRRAVGSVIGMCFTGGFALATAVEDVVKAPVLSQPSTSFLREHLTATV